MRVACVAGCVLENAVKVLQRRVRGVFFAPASSTLPAHARARTHARSKAHTHTSTHTHTHTRTHTQLSALSATEVSNCVMVYFTLGAAVFGALALVAPTRVEAIGGSGRIKNEEPQVMCGGGGGEGSGDC